MRRIGCFAVLGMTVMLASCSVKEDRSTCPCWLQVNVSNVIVDKFQLRGWWNGEILFEKTLYRETPGGVLEFKVPRGTVELSAIYGQMNLVESAGALMLPKGSRMDSLFAYSAALDTRIDEVADTLALHKNFAHVVLDFKDVDDGRAGYDMKIKGNVSGLSVRTLDPIEGDFDIVPEDSEERGYEFLLPRQLDDSLTAEMWYKGKRIKTIPLGKYIAKAGFDWSLKDLGDIYILADLPGQKFTITIKEWEGPVLFTITI